MRKLKTLIPFKHKGKTHVMVRTPKVGIGVGNCADVTRHLTRSQSGFWQTRQDRRVEHAKAVRSIAYADLYDRLMAIKTALAK